MSRFIILLICLMSTVVFAANDVVAPVVIKGDKDGEAQMAVFTAEPTAQPPNALSILRDELHRQESIEQAKQHKDGVFISTTKRFAPESLTFFVAMGAVTFNSMWIKSHGDPLAMERQILSLKDPVAHLSFYSFMMTQGYYMNFRAPKGAMDASTRSQLMRRLSYEGMAIGSFASSVVGDLGQSVTMCINKWIKGKTDNDSLASCDEAWKSWTVRNKFTQYFPQIISMWASQATTELVEGTASRAFSRVAVTSFVQKLLTKDFLVKQAYKISAADVVLTFGGGGWFTKSLKLVGKITRFGLFLSVDHILSNYTYRPVNNLIKPALFDFDAMAINKLWLAADKGYWNSVHVNNLPKFEKEIENFGNQMQQWREHLNSDAEADLSGWMEMTKKLLNQLDYSYKFYRGFAGTLFETLSIGSQIQNKQLAPGAAAVISRYPLRTLPFYGVTPGPWKAIGGATDDLYLTSPNEIEKHQKEHVLDVAEKMKAAPLKVAREQADYSKIIGKLLSDENERMASGLNDINQAIALYELEMSQEQPYSMTSYEYIAQLRKLRDTLGHPQPVVYPLAGYAQAFAAYGPNNVIADAADFPKWSVIHKYKFNKEADLMMYRLICGDPQSHVRKISVVGVNILSPQFVPPSLLNANNDRAAFCSSIRTTGNLYSTPIAGVPLRSYILKNANYNAIGDFREKGDPTRFELWWFSNAKAPLAEEFKGYDVKFKEVFEMAYNNFFDHRNLFKFVVDGLNQSRYLPNSLVASLKFETNLYLQILNRVVIADSGANPNPPPSPPPPPQTTWEKVTSVLSFSPYTLVTNAVINEFAEYNYVEFAAKNAEEINYKSLYKKSPREIIRLNDLLAGYYSFIITPNVKFDQYIAYSKSIDTAINDVLVLAGLKKLVATRSEEVEDLSAPASASGSEMSEKSYEDIPVENPTYKQRMTVAAVRGIHQVEAEIRRFIRMRISLSQSLELDTQEFMADWNNSNKRQATGGAKLNPLGAR